MGIENADRKMRMEKKQKNTDNKKSKKKKTRNVDGNKKNNKIIKQTIKEVAVTWLNPSLTFRT